MQIKSYVRKYLIVQLILIVMMVSSIPPKVSANPVVAGAGIEAGVGAYVLAVLALSAGATLVGQPDTADRIKQHAYGVWDTTQATLGVAWQASVQASAALAKDVKSPWVLSLYKDAYNALKPLPTTDLRYDFFKLALASEIGVSGSGAHYSNDDTQGLFVAGGNFTIVYKGFMYKAARWYSSAYPGNGKLILDINGGQITHYPKLVFSTTFISGADMGTKALSFAAALGATIYSKPSLTVLNPAGDDLLPKTGEDYKIKIPALDNFIPYPKTATGTPDVTRGPLVVNPADRNTYKDAATGQVYNPADVAFDYPVPSIKTNTQTGAKEVGFVDTATGTWVKSTDTTATDTGTANPPLDWSETPTDGLNFGPLRIAGNLFTTKFPFSIPWDIQRQFNVFNVAPKPPVLRVDKTIPLFNTEMKLKFDIDFTIMEPAAVVVRWFMIIAFDLGLILSMRKFMPE